MYSGPVAAGHAYATLEGARGFDVAVLVGPSHYVAFDGVSSGAGRRVFEFALGDVPVPDGDQADALVRARPRR